MITKKRTFIALLITPLLAATLLLSGCSVNFTLNEDTVNDAVDSATEAADNLANAGEEAADAAEMLAGLEFEKATRIVVCDPDSGKTIKEITDQTLPTKESAPFFVFVPTYLDGGNGFDSGFTEMMTNALGEYIGQNDNASQCMGVVGSGNKNFNEQYCLTARKYSDEFKVPFLADYELRGTDRDIERIYAILKQRAAEFNA